MTVQFKEGMIIENTKCPHWGPGKIVHLSGPNMHVIFRDLEEDMAKLLRMDLLIFRLATAQADSTLDNLPPLIEKNGRWILPTKRYTLDTLKKTFHHYFPAGFADPKFHTGERTYKMDAHIKFNQILGIEQMRALLASGNIRDLASKAISIEAKLNLLSVFEKAAFRDGLRYDATTEPYFASLLNVLDEEHLTESTFNIYLNRLHALPVEGHKVASWPVATLFLYLADPFKHMFLKPQVTKSAADSLGFDLKYDATPNWQTYDALLRLGHTYLKLPKPMGARDFVDIQSFIYVTCGGYESAIAGRKSKGDKRIVARESETTLPGYENDNGQVVIGRTQLRGTDYGQWVYELRCKNCGEHYGANGSDIWQRKCPNCGNGAKGLVLEESSES